VNNKARGWGGVGFARQLLDRFPEAAHEYAEWAKNGRPLGSKHLSSATHDVYIASIVAQSGYGPPESGKPRLRLTALRDGLEALAEDAARLHAEVHMPLIGTGQAGMTWPAIRDLVLQELSDRDVRVTVHLLPDVPMPDEVADAEQLALL
jgi:hypothetical protein